MGLLARIGLALLAVVAMVATMTGCSSEDGEAAGAGVGECFAALPGTDASTIDCSDQKAVYKVAQSSESETTCATDYTAAERKTGDSTAYLCLVPNFHQDGCYSDTGQTGYQSVDCAAPEASFRVLQRIDGEADELLCGADATGFRVVTDDPKVTFCTGAAKP
ncbi:hypothetical protein GCM10023318_53780 [Nocardia callitridis]|uniref:Pyridine nucleotide-disulfide oxidoreductase n=1 Tax=Nocardia callitridis TaxID=648753 RepID=A0ABP9KU36_9NOCA